VIGAGVVVRPFAVLVGPCAILDGSTVAERSLIKASTVIGPHCRAGGEIGGTIFQAYSNKSHDGHLGDSFVGEWVNIGAGSDNSNLLNTYGEVIVRLEADGGLTRTGRQFWGAVIGDHVKLAIGTRLMTGTTIGTGAMIACSRSPATLVPRFSWLTDSADGPKSFRIDKFLETARAMMSRRGKAPTPAVEAAIRALHAKATGA
jgi:UDP-N-acetylglucosamine diphosphorylase/glucosamine-1-phosphate N-acetyltransferase